MPTVGSLFSGIGGFDLGLERAGFEVAWQCEIDPFCNKVLAKHWPEVRRYGDVRDIGCAVGVDLICGGFPCQDLSVAGKRAGLDGARSGLWFEFHRILSELRPTYCLVENVPGLLSSNKGQDFAIVLEGLGQLWPAIGWAVLDSQHFGVPQRRRRVYIVGGSSRERVQQILSLCEGGDWHSQTSRAKRQDVANPLGASATSFGGQRFDLDHETYIPLAHSLSADGFDASEDGTRRGTPLVLGETHARTPEGNPVALLPELRQAVGEEAFAEWRSRVFDSLQSTAVLQPSLHGGSLRREAGHGYSEMGDRPLSRPQGLSCSALLSLWEAANGSPSQRRELAEQLSRESSSAVSRVSPQGSSVSVRRLTPVEAERLQGFPDSWTDIGGTADGPRYKALGNAVTVPVIEYIGRRIIEVMNGNP